MFLAFLLTIYHENICFSVHIQNTNYVKLSEDEINTVLADNQQKLNLTNKQTQGWHKKCMCLVEFEKQSKMDDWLIIDKIEDVLVGTSIPYNYDKLRF